MESQLIDIAAARQSHATPSVWIVVPAYREGARLGSALDKLCERFPNVIVVDDGSDDDTSQVASQYPVCLLRHAFNRGQGAALQTGFDYAIGKGGKIVVSFDGDGQHQVEDIERLIKPIARGEVDVTLGSRFRGQAINISRRRRIILKLGILFTRVVSRIRLTDTHNGLRAFSARALGEVRITLDRMAHASELLDQIRSSGLRYCEVPVTIRYSPETIAKGQRGRGAIGIAAEFLLAKLVR